MSTAEFLSLTQFRQFSNCSLLVNREKSGDILVCLYLLDIFAGIIGLRIGGWEGLWSRGYGRLLGVWRHLGRMITTSSLKGDNYE